MGQAKVSCHWKATVLVVEIMTCLQTARHMRTLITGNLLTHDAESESFNVQRTQSALWALSYLTASFAAAVTISSGVGGPTRLKVMPCDTKPPVFNPRMELPQKSNLNVSHCEMQMQTRLGSKNSRLCVRQF